MEKQEICIKCKASEKGYHGLIVIPCNYHAMCDTLLECLEEAKLSMNGERKEYMIKICNKARNEK